MAVRVRRRHELEEGLVRGLDIASDTARLSRHGAQEAFYAGHRKVLLNL